MSEIRVVKVRFFGGFRRIFANQKPEISLTLDTEARSIGDLRQKLQRELTPEGIDLLSESVFADESRVLPEHEFLANRTSLAVLPPVCGG